MDKHLTKPSRTPQMIWWIIGATVFVVGAVYVLLEAPSFLVHQSLGADVSKLSSAERVKADTDARQGVLFAIGGLIAIVTLLFTRAKHVLEEKKQELERDSDRTSRYTEAIRQVGDGSVSVRLGGIYALERIAQDSPRDRQTILDVLCAYLRDKSPAGIAACDTLAADLAAAATVVGRVALLSEPKYIVNLRDTNLRGADLADSNLYKADLSGSDLSLANLTRTNLTGAKLVKAILRDATLTNAILENASLNEADLSSAKLHNANLISAKLDRANLQRAVLTDANLGNVDLTDTVLEAATFRRANLTGATRMAKISGGFTRVLMTDDYLRQAQAFDGQSVIGLSAKEIEIATGQIFRAR